MAARRSRAARRAIDEALEGGLSVAHEAVRLAFPVALEASIDLSDSAEADRLVNLLATHPRGEVPPFLRAQVNRARAVVARAQGDGETVEENLVAAEVLFRDLGYPYWTARAQLDRADWLADTGRLEEAGALATQAAATFEMVGVHPMMARGELSLSLRRLASPASTASALSFRALRRPPNRPRAVVLKSRPRCGLVPRTPHPPTLDRFAGGVD